MATSEEAGAAREAKLDTLHERLATAVGQLSTGDDWKQALEFAAKFRSRSFGNTLLICAQHLDAFDQGRVSAPEPTYVAGYKQWQTLGRQVEKNQPGYMIFAPVTGRFASSTPQDPASWRRLGRFEKPKPGEAVRSRMVGAKPAYVWDVSQTAGDPIPERPSPVLLEGEAPEGLWEGLAGLVKAEGFVVLRVEHAGMIHSANGLTDYRARTVAVRTDMDAAAQVKTLAHELAHVKLHGPDSPDATGHRGIGEVEAESVALMIGAAHGMDTSSAASSPPPPSATRRTGTTSWQSSGSATSPVTGCGTPERPGWPTPASPCTCSKRFSGTNRSRPPRVTCTPTTGTSPKPPDRPTSSSLLPRPEGTPPAATDPACDRLQNPAPTLPEGAGVPSCADSGPLHGHLMVHFAGDDAERDWSTSTATSLSGSTEWTSQ